MADRRSVLIPLIILGFLLFSPDPGQATFTRYDHQRALNDAIARERDQLIVQQTFQHDEFDPLRGRYLNISGFGSESPFAWDVLPRVKQRATEHLNHALSVAPDGAIPLLDPSAKPLFWGNISGHIRGKWTRSPLQDQTRAPHLNSSFFEPEGPVGPYDPRPFSRNITGKVGDIRIHLGERESDINEKYGQYNVSGVRAEISLKDDQTADEWTMYVHGVHLIDIGHVILTTTNTKFAGIFALPQFAASVDMFEAAQGFLTRSINRTIELQTDGAIRAINPWSPTPDHSESDVFVEPKCELVVYLQQKPIRPSAMLRDLKTVARVEQELRSPTGAKLGTIPNLSLSMLAFSPDCGYIIESQGPPDFAPSLGNHLAGPKIEVLFSTSRRHLLLFMCTIALQLNLLIRQMREANTPSTRSRLSFYTIAMLCLGDGFTAMSLLFASVFVPILWVVLMGTAFLSFNSVSFFGMRFLMDIWNVQAPEREARARHAAELERRRREIEADRLREQASGMQLRSDENETAEIDQPHQTSSSNPLPLPVTAQWPTDTGAAAVFMPSTQDGLLPAAGPAGPETDSGSSFGALYTRFYLFLLVALFTSLNAVTWPYQLRRIYFTLLGLCYLSFWVPQISRNVQRNCRRALKWEFILGQSALRLVPFAYTYGYKENILFAPVDYHSLSLMVVWLWIQIITLASQEMIGPRWFIRQEWAPPAYDYHPVLRDDQEGASMPIGFSEAQQKGAESGPATPSSTRRGSLVKETRGRGKRVFDCAICMQDLEVPVIEVDGPSDALLGGGLLARRTYMVTPCRHIFHSACLEGWMKFRLQCPICRETLPPL